MVTLKQVFKISSFVGILNLSVSVANTATEVNFAATSEGVQVELPVDLIKVQAVLDEGTQVELSEDQVEEMLPWAQNSKVFLEDLLERVRTLPLSDKFDQTVSGIKDSVLSSAPKNTELLMRYVLNRSLKVVEVINEQIGTEKNTSTLNVQFNILKDSIELAIKYYKNDLSFITNRAQSDNLVAFSSFGIKYAQFLYQYTKLVFDASAQYQLMRMTLGFLQWDLYRDQNNNLYAPIIMTINHELSNNPEDLNVSDQEYLKRVRNMKRTYEQQREKTSVIAKQSSSQKGTYRVPTNSVTPGSHAELQCKKGTHVVSIFGKTKTRKPYTVVASLGLRCSDGSRVGPVSAYAARDRSNEVFSSLKGVNGFYKLSYAQTDQNDQNDLKGLTLFDSGISIKTGSAHYSQKVECKSKDHVITGIGVKESVYINTVTYIKCDIRR